MGMIKYTKGVHTAIEVAKKAGKRLVIAGPMNEDDPDGTYFKNYIEPELGDDLQVEYVGCLDGLNRINALSNAKALIFPTMIEAFGLVAIEAMASGTPVLFTDDCTGKEILKDAFPQCLCHSIDEMVTTIVNDDLPSSAQVFNHVLNYFTIENMTEGYVECYEELIKEGKFKSTIKPKKQTISLCMIAKDEENNLKQCLDSVHDLVDEIIIVDTGSTDRTKEVALSYDKVKLVDFEWIYNFSAARNESIKHATCDYIMFLDCDDMFKEDSRVKLRELKDSMDGSIDLYWFYYDYRHNRDGESTYSFLTERIFKNFRGVKWNCIVHEVLELGGMRESSVKTDIRITHTSNHDNTDTYMNFFKINSDNGYQFNSREKYFYIMELYKHKEYDTALPLLQDIIQDPDTINTYEQSSVYGMLAYINKDRHDYKSAIQNYLMATSFHQPLPAIYFEIGNCYSSLGMLTHAMFYYKSLLVDNLFFKENFSNESVYTNFDNDLRRYRIDALLSMLMIYYNDVKDIPSAEECNNALLLMDPANESGIHNKEFFDKLRGMVKL